MEGANVVKADIECRNGLIHVIDTVLVPKENLVNTARNAGSFTIFLQAVEAADLMETLSGKGPFTVFAPTDRAFKKLPAEVLRKLLDNPEKLKSVLTLHLVRGRILSEDLKRMKSLQTEQGESLRIEDSNGVKVNGARLVEVDVKTTNGVLHAVDAVFLP